MLVDDVDGVLFDLDGVIYLGDEAIPAAKPTLAALRERAIKVGFVTNNAGLAPEVMAERIAGFGIRAEAADLVTSAQAIVTELVRHVDPGANILIVGSAFLAEEVERRGLTPVHSADDDPAAVVQGFGTEIDQPMLLEGCLALSRDLPWYVSNLDLTIPGDRGIGPGCGSFVQLIQGVTKREPTAVAGKPYAPLFQSALERLGADRPMFVGDRLDTDIEGAKREGIATLWVMTGAHGQADLLAAPEERRPDAIARDVGGLLQERRAAEQVEEGARCGGATARVRAGRIELEPGDDPVDALWALATAAWASPEADYAEALAVVDLP